MNNFTKLLEAFGQDAYIQKKATTFSVKIYVSNGMKKKSPDLSMDELFIREYQKTVKKMYSAKNVPSDATYDIKITNQSKNTTGAIVTLKSNDKQWISDRKSHGK